MTARHQRGLLLALMAAAISGVSVFTNSLVVKGIDPLIHTTVKNGVAGFLVLLVLVTSRDGLRDARKLTLKHWGLLVAIALVGGSVAFALFFTGLKMVGATQGTLIHKTLVIWIALMAVPLLKEKVTWKMSAGIVMLYGSSLLLGGGGFKGLLPGHGMVFMATLLWAIENIIAKVALKEIPVNIVVSARMGLGSLILLGMVIIQDKMPLLAKLSSSQWVMLSIVGLLLFGYVMSWYRALKILPATATAGVIVGATVVTTLLDAVFVNHTITPVSLMQSGLIVSGIFIIVQSLREIWRRQPELSKESHVATLNAKV